jgi:hypothetical protein
MPGNAIQREIDELKGVSKRLVGLADEHPAVEMEMTSISGNVMHNAVLLEVILTTKINKG